MLLGMIIPLELIHAELLATLKAFTTTNSLAFCICCVVNCANAARAAIPDNCIDEERITMIFRIEVRKSKSL